ncbi:MAG: DUF4375 domain-containing protein, partial [Planctomycetota bacterium]
GRSSPASGAGRGRPATGRRRVRVSVSASQISSAENQHPHTTLRLTPDRRKRQTRCPHCLDQYFFNSYADTWPDAIAGYELVGAKEHLKIVKQAVRKFGRSGPSVDRDQRQAQLSRLLNKNEGVFDKLTDRYFNVSSTVDECVTRYRIDT